MVLASFKMTILPALFVGLLSLPLCFAATVTYDWTITWVEANPDGELLRPVVGINGKWPGPPIKANLGDQIVINTHNHLGNETFSLHWHGIHQTGSASMDGPPAVTQCEIPPGASFTYSFTVCRPLCTSCLD